MSSAQDARVYQHDKFQALALDKQLSQNSYTSNKAERQNVARTDISNVSDVGSIRSENVKQTSVKKENRSSFKKNRDKLIASHQFASQGSNEHLDDPQQQFFVHGINPTSLGRGFDLDSTCSRSPIAAKRKFSGGLEQDNYGNMSDQDDGTRGGMLLRKIPLKRQMSLKEPQINQIEEDIKSDVRASVDRSQMDTGVSTPGQSLIPQPTPNLLNSLSQLNNNGNEDIYNQDSMGSPKRRRVGRVQQKLERLEQASQLPASEQKTKKTKQTILDKIAETASFKSDASGFSRHEDEGIDLSKIQSKFGTNHILQAMTTVQHNMLTPVDGDVVVGDDKSFHSNREEEGNNSDDETNRLNYALEANENQPGSLRLNVEQDGASVYDKDRSHDIFKIATNKKTTDDSDFHKSKRATTQVYYFFEFPRTEKLRRFSDANQKDLDEEEEIADRKHLYPKTDYVDLQPRTMMEIRQTYMSRLSYKGVWLHPQKQPKTHQNLIILDWDDTLLPTTFFLNQEQNSEESDLGALAQKNKKVLVAIQRQVLPLLENLIKFGKVVIITNAKEGWVEYSSYFMLPRVHHLIETYIPVISAQDEYSKKHPKAVQKWKQEAFMSLWDIEGLLDKNPYASMLNFIVVGDSDYEINAGKIFKKKTCAGRKCQLKLIKLKENPTPIQLEKQLLVLNQKFNYICGSQKCLNIQLESNASSSNAAKNNRTSKAVKSKQA